MGQGRHIYKAVGGLSLGGDRLRKRALNMYSQLSEKLDLIVLMNDIEPSLDLSFFYVTGLESGLFEGCVALIRPDGEILGQFCCSGIARGAVDLLHQGGLGDLPDQRMFAATAADNEYFHGLHLDLNSMGYPPGISVH